MEVDLNMENAACYAEDSILQFSTEELEMKFFEARGIAQHSARQRQREHARHNSAVTRPPSRAPRVTTGPLIVWCAK